MGAGSVTSPQTPASSSWKLKQPHDIKRGLVVNSSARYLRPMHCSSGSIGRIMGSAPENEEQGRVASTLGSRARHGCRRKTRIPPAARFT